MFVLIDCNTFYCSCERLSKPWLEGKPVVVLSNNDSCVISLTEEARALGIIMGTPAFMVREIMKQHNIAVFSSNFTLYGDISNRVMKTLEEHLPKLEIYSIDEAFGDVSGMQPDELLPLGIRLKKLIRRHIGIPVSIGIAPTKTLAKMANRYAKKVNKEAGVHCVITKEEINHLLSVTDAGDVWGIGDKYSAFLLRQGYHTAMDISHAPEAWIKQHLHVTGQRTWHELKGTPAIEWNEEPSKKKNICVALSFGELTKSKDVVREALCDYTALIAKKLRQQNSCAGELELFVQTNVHRLNDKRYYRSIKISLDIPSNETTKLISYAIKGFEIIFREGYQYMKCGVTANDLVPEECIQTSLFEDELITKRKELMSIMDNVNGISKGIVKMASQGVEKNHKPKANFLSGKFTTQLSQVIKVAN